MDCSNYISIINSSLKGEAFMGRIEQLEKQINYFTNIEQGKHAVLLYEDKKKVMQSAVPFIKAGIEKNERAIYIDGAGERKVIISKLAKYISGISEYLDTGQLLILTADEYYGEDDSFDADKMVEKLKDIILTSKETGFSSTRITG